MGTLQGLRGFNDPRAIRLVGGNSVSCRPIARGQKRSVLLDTSLGPPGTGNIRLLQPPALPKACYGRGPLCRTMLTVLPASTMCPAVGDWLNTQELVPFCPENLATSPAAWTRFAASAAEVSSTLGTVLFAGLPTCSMCQFTM